MAARIPRVTGGWQDGKEAGREGYREGRRVCTCGGKDFVALPACRAISAAGLKRDHPLKHQ